MGRRWPNRFGFTLIELLVVISIIVLLLAILMPSLKAAKEAAYSAMCKSNLNSIAKTLHLASSDMDGSFPTASGWLGTLSSHGPKDLAICPKGQRDTDGLSGGLELLFVRHHTHHGDIYDASVAEAFDPSNADLLSFSDPGELRGKNTYTVWEQVGVRHVSETKKEFHLFGMGAISFDIGEVITITDMPSVNPNIGGSDHDLILGDELVMNLRGKNYPKAVPSSLTLQGGGTASYGMSSVVTDTDPRSGQMMMMDYNKLVIDVDGAGSGDDDFEEYIAPRHLGRVNATLVDGSVDDYAPWQLMPDEDNWHLWEP